MPLGWGRSPDCIGFELLEGCFEFTAHLQGCPMAGTPLTMEQQALLPGAIAGAVGAGRQIGDRPVTGTR